MESGEELDEPEEVVFLGEWKSLVLQFTLLFHFIILSHLGHESPRARGSCWGGVMVPVGVGSSQ